MNWIFVLLVLWLSSFSPSERVALGSAFLVLIGVIGEEISEFKVLEGQRKERIKKAVKRFAIGILVLGLAGDLGSVVMGQAEMAALTSKAGDAKQSADGAAASAKRSQGSADAANSAAGTAQEKADAASIASGKAQNEADAVGIQAADLLKKYIAAEAKLEVERKKLDILENETGWRTANVQTVEDKIKQFPGTPFIVLHLDDPECERLAGALNEAMQDAKWTPTFSGVVPLGTTNFPTGVALKLTHDPRLPTRDPNATIDAARALFSVLFPAGEIKGTITLEGDPSVCMPFNRTLEQCKPGYRPNVVIVNIGRAWP